MNTSEYGDAQLLWKMFYAGECFRQTIGAARHILEAKLESGSPLFYPLMTAVYVLYAKPFTRADAVGKLEDEIVPAEWRELHDSILKHRHQVYAHRDGDGFEVGEFGPVNQVRAVRLPTEIRLVAADFSARFPLMPHVIELCQLLGKTASDHVDELLAKHAKNIPNKIGEYMLNVQDISADMWLPQKPMVLMRERRVDVREHWC
jgi:hypothetical protein